MLTVNPMDPMDMDIAMDKVRVRDEGATFVTCFVVKKRHGSGCFGWLFSGKHRTKIKFHMVLFDGDCLFHDDGNHTEKLFL